MTRNMRKLPSLSFLLMMTVNSFAYADSFCSYDAGLIGTKAIGDIRPNSLKDAVIDPETKACTLLAYDRASSPDSETSLTSQAQSYKCEEFTHMPSLYIDGYNGSVYNPEGFPIASSDYFALLAFENSGNWVQVSLRTGEKKWVEAKKHSVLDFPDQYKGEGVASTIGHKAPTQTGFYSAPRLNAPAAPIADYIGGYTRPIIQDK